MLKAQRASGIMFVCESVCVQVYVGEGRLSPGNDGDELTCGCSSSKVNVVDGAAVVVGRN